jgi:polyvinyl alcohol dehydrogenase (cytochrome)
VPAAAPSPSPSASSAVPSSAWTSFLHDPQRSGRGEAQQGLGSPRLAWTSATFDGEVYAEPLVLNASVYVATENNTVYSLSAATGKVSWSRHLGEPVPGGQLPCGQIPTVGITSTPVIDPGANRLFAVGLVGPGVYHLYGIDLGAGEVKLDQALDLHALDPKVEGQRGALSLSGGRLLVPFGGRNGDCGDYHGLILSLSATGPTDTRLYRVPSGRAAGIWAPGGATVDAAGRIWAATGNSFSASAYDYANTLVRLSPELTVQDSFAPRDWLALNDSDLDLGSSSPVLVGSDLVFQAGKNGSGYLLDRTHLGGIGGDLFSARICLGVFGSAVYAAPLLYIPCLDGLFAVRVDEPARRFSVAWRSGSFQAGSPIVVGGAAWVLDFELGVIHAYDPTGAERFAASVGPAVHFATPAAGAGCIFVPSKTHLSAICL